MRKQKKSKKIKLLVKVIIELIKMFMRIITGATAMLGILYSINAFVEVVSGNKILSIMYFISGIYVIYEMTKAELNR